LPRIRSILFPIVYAQKKCPSCSSFQIKKYGHQSGRQKFRCVSCGRQFVRRYKKNERWVKRAYDDYTKHRQTYNDLRRNYSKDPKTLRKYFDAHAAATGEIIAEKTPINLLMDATFFSRTNGLLVCRANSRNLYWKEITSEKVEYYVACLDALEAVRFSFKSFIIDGRKGVRDMLWQRYPDVPIQLCQFHQLQTITQKLTKRPKLPASKELRSIALTLTRTTREEFTVSLDQWYERWDAFLKERTESVERKRRWRYTHEKLRSAYFSLRRNLPWLFTYQDFPELHIPNTTNSCDGSFTHWKNKVKLHRGIKKSRKKKMIDYLLEK